MDNSLLYSDESMEIKNQNFNRLTELQLKYKNFYEYKLTMCRLIELEKYY